MRLPILIIAALAALPAAAHAQSLTDTHERVWAPSGKTPALHYRPLARNACAVARTGAHPWHKGQPHSAQRCADRADTAANESKAANRTRPGA